MELTLDQALQKGIEAHKAGKVQEADRYYTAILKANPKHPDANHNMGVLAVGVGQVEAALPFFKAALDVKSNIAQYWLSYIDALIKLDRMVDAKAVFDEAKSKGVKGDGFDLIEGRLKIGAQSKADQLDEGIVKTDVALRESGKYDEAINLLLSEINRSSKDPNIPAVLSHCYILNDDLEKAKAFLAAAKNINSDTPLVGWNEARILLKEKKVKEALAIASKTNELFPDDVEGMGVLGSCLSADGNFDESLKYLNKAIKLNPDYAEAFINRGLIYLNKKDNANTLSDLEKAHYLKPHIRGIWSLVLSLNMERKEFEHVIRLAEGMVKLDPKDERIFATLAACHQQLKHYDQAILYNKKALALKPEYVEVLNNMGAALQEQGKLEEAKRHAKSPLHQA